MNKEHFKNILISILVLSSLFLSAEIWLSEKLWSKDHDFFSVFKETYIGNLIFNFKDNSSTLSINDTGALDSIFAPKTTMLSFSDGRLTLDATNDDGKKVIDALNEILKVCFSNENFYSVSEEQWQKALCNNGIYADYSVPVSVSALADYLDADYSVNPNISTFDKLAVLTSESSSRLLIVYFRDSKTQSNYGINISYNVDSLTAFLSDYSTKPMLNLSYSFELNLDKKVVGSGQDHQKVILDSYILLPLDATPMNSVKEENINIRTEENSNKILEVLGYNKKTVKKFTSADDTVHFVDSKSTLTIGSNYIEYEASKNGDGIKIGNNSNITTAAAGSAELIDKITGIFEINKNTKLFISSPIGNEQNGEYSFTFNYLFNAVPIELDYDSCSVKVKNGKITYMKFYIKSFVEAGALEDSFALNVLEKVYNREQRYVKIENLSIGYVKNGNKFDKIWEATVDGKKIDIY